MNIYIYKVNIRKKYKDDINEDDDEDDVKNDNEVEEIKEPQKTEEFILLKPLKKRPTNLNKKIIKDETKKAYIKSLSRIYNNYYHKEISDELNNEIVISSKI